MAHCEKCDTWTKCTECGTGYTLKGDFTGCLSTCDRFFFLLFLIVINKKKKWVCQKRRWNKMRKKYELHTIKSSS